ncbi:MAG TPA: winged helix-turn-helix domain-containing protein [Nitrosarchaeum sp.]
MEKIKEDNENFDKIKIFSSEDEKLKLLGELLSNKSSRDIIKLLIDKEMYTNEIVKKLDLKVSLVIHHLQKMESIGLLEITNKKIARNGEEHRFFRIPTGMLIVPNKSEEDTNSGFLKKIFKKGVKFAVIGGIALFVWINTTLHKNSQVDDSEFIIGDILDIPFYQESSFFPLLIIIIGLIVDRIISYKKNKKSH